MDWKRKLGETVLAAVISGTVVGGILKWQFDKDLAAFHDRRERMELSLTQIVGPATMHFARTEAVAARYGRSPNQYFGDAALLRESNAGMRTLMIEKGYLLPPHLLAPAQCLVVHYDIWLKRFDATMEAHLAEHGKPPAVNDRFDVGFAELEDRECGGFPEEVPAAFEAEFARLRHELYGIE